MPSELTSIQSHPLIRAYGRLRFNAIVGVILFFFYSYLMLFMWRYLQKEKTGNFVSNINKKKSTMYEYKNPLLSSNVSVKYQTMKVFTRSHSYIYIGKRSDRN